MHIRDVTQILVNFDFVNQELNFSVETPFNHILVPVNLLFIIGIRFL